MRELRHGLEVAGHLERREQGGRRLADRREIGVVGPRDGDERLDLLLGELGRNADHRSLGHVGVGAERLLDLGGRNVLATAADDLLLAPHERVRPVRVPVHEIARPQPPVGAHGLRGLLGHVPVPAHHRRVSQLELADLAVRDIAPLGNHARLVHRSQARVLPDRPERAERSRSVGPDHAVRRLRERVPTDDSKAKSLFHLDLPCPGWRRACVTQAKRRIGIVISLRLAHEDLEHRPDCVELRGAVPPRRVQERARREPREQHESGPRGE